MKERAYTEYYIKQVHQLTFAAILQEILYGKNPCIPLFNQGSLIQ